MPSRVVPDDPAVALAYSPAEAASLLGVHRTTLYEWMREGRLASVKVGNRRLITRAALLRLLGEAPDPGSAA